MSQKTKGIIAILIMTFFGGGVAPFAVKIGLKSFTPLIFSEIRFIITVFIFIPVIFKVKKELRHKDYPKVFFISSLGTAFNAVLFAFGIRFTTASAALTIYNLQPIMVAVLGFLILGERINKQKILGLVIGLSGTVLIILKSLQNDPSLEASIGTFKGNFFILLAMLSFSFYLILSKKLSKTFSASLITASSMLSATVFVFPLALLEVSKNSNFLHNIQAESIVGLIVTVLSSSLFYYLLQYGTKRLPALSVSLLNLLSPFHAVVVGTLFFEEKLTLTLIAGGVLIILGALLSLKQVNNK